MDVLYFNTNDREALIEELGLEKIVEGSGREISNGFLYEHADGWALMWIGKVPLSIKYEVDENGVESEAVIEWQDGDFFNIYLIGQENMDYFTQRLKNAVLLKEPQIPNFKLL